jgi:hypothetical protein
MAELRIKDGPTLTERVDTMKGSEKRPTAVDEVIQKYTILAGKVLRPRGVAELHDMVLNLENVSDVRKLTKLLLPQMDG